MWETHEDELYQDLTSIYSILLTCFSVLIRTMTIISSLVMQPSVSSKFDATLYINVQSYFYQFCWPLQYISSLLKFSLKHGVEVKHFSHCVIWLTCLSESCKLFIIVHAATGKKTSKTITFDWIKAMINRSFSDVKEGVRLINSRHPTVIIFSKVFKWLFLGIVITSDVKQKISERHVPEHNS